MKGKQKEAAKRTEWKLSEWNEHYRPASDSTIMTEVEIQEAIGYLRENNYPKPTDCHEQGCPKFRPACQLGICRIAVGMCGDF